MAFTVAVAGKGGTGKTTIAALLISSLVKQGRQPVLAVDADPNPNLDIALGARIGKTIGELREDLLDAIRKLPPGMTKDDYLEMGIQECLSEGKGIDLLAMGCGEGPRCYCAVNHVLRRCIDRLRGSYPYMVIDNEAGLENLSRRIVRSVDLLVLTGDPSKRGLETVRRLYGLAVEMKISYKKLAIIINRLRNDASIPDFGALRAAVPADHFLALPENSDIAGLAERGAGIGTLPRTNAVAAMMDGFIDNVLK